MADLSSDDGLSTIGELIDISHDLRNTDSLNKAVIFASELQRRSLDAEHFGRLHYFLGNAWSNLHNLVNQTAAWEDAAFERAIFHFRAAVSKEESILALPKQQVCQICTNLANILSDTGRVVEAIELWEEALRIVPGYGMTVGSHGYGLFKYAYVVPDPGHARFIITSARDRLSRAIALPLEHEGARRFFTERLAEARSSRASCRRCSPTCSVSNRAPCQRRNGPSARFDRGFGKRYSLFILVSEDSPVNQKVLLVMLCRLGLFGECGEPRRPSAALPRRARLRRDHYGRAGARHGRARGRYSEKDARTWMDREIELTSVTLQPDARMLA